VKDLNTNHYDASISDEPFYCLSDETQAIYWIQLTAIYHSSVVAAYCLETHEKALYNAIGNLTQPQLSSCMHTTGVRNISIRNIMLISRSVDEILYLPS
jgi:hypothetical protein